MGAGPERANELANPVSRKRCQSAAQRDMPEAPFTANFAENFER